MSAGPSELDFVPHPDDPLRRASPEVGDVEARRARSSIASRLFSGPPEPIRVGRYRVEGRIGSGGMGVVYRAHDPELARDVAVKLMHSDSVSTADEKTARARLVREARAMARLAHPNVIHVYDVGTVEDGVFIAMELVDGISLAKWLAEEERDWREVLQVCLDAGRGLAAAHEAAIVHRDFKPENVIVGRDGRARVGDFGLAGGAPATTGRPGPRAHDDSGPTLGPQHHLVGDRDSDSGLSEIIDHDDDALPHDAAVRHSMEDGTPGLLEGSGSDELGRTDEADGSSLDHAAISGSLTRTGMLLGTPKYMAPEQEAGSPPSPLSDQFSFCVALFEALYGFPPFEGDTVARYRRRVHAGRIRPAPTEAKVKAWVHTEIVRGLEPEPEDRHASMAALIERLEGALIDPSPARRRRRRVRRWMIAGALGVIGVGAAASLGVAVSELWEESQSPAVAAYSEDPEQGAGAAAMSRVDDGGDGPSDVGPPGADAGDERTSDAELPPSAPGAGVDKTQPGAATAGNLGNPGDPSDVGAPSDPDDPGAPQPGPADDAGGPADAGASVAADSPSASKPTPPTTAHRPSPRPSSKTPRKRGPSVCYFQDDTLSFVGQSRAPTRFVRGRDGSCWDCKNRVHEARTGGLDPANCKKNFQCYAVDDDTQCE